VGSSGSIHLLHSKLQRIEKDTMGSIMSKTKCINLILVNNSSSLLKLNFKEGRDEFFDHYYQALSKKGWEIQVKEVSKPPPPQSTIEKLNNKDPNYNFSTKSAGITGIIQTTHKKIEQEKNNLNQAFSDLESLIDNADKMVFFFFFAFFSSIFIFLKRLQVKLARKFKEEQSKGDKGENTNNSNTDEIFLSMGVVSSITKQILFIK
jgi:hypothetical protein